MERVSTGVQDSEKRRSVATFWHGSHHTLLAGITFLGLVLRLFHLGAQSFWHDEALSALLAAKDWSSILLTTAQDVHPPLYYLLLHAWLLLGRSEAVIRLLSALAGVAAIPVTFALAQAIFESRPVYKDLAQQIGLLSALFMAIAPFQIVYAQEARMYTLFLLLTELATLFFLRVVRSGQRRDLLGLVACSALSLYTDYFALFLLLVYGSFVLIFWRRYNHLLKPLITAALAVLILFLPWLNVFLHQAGAVAGSYWIERPTLVAPFATLYLFMVSYSLPNLELPPTFLRLFQPAEAWPRLVVPIVPFSLFLSLGFFAIILNEARRVLRSKGRMRESITFVLLFLFLSPTATYFISLMRPIYLDRALLFTAPGLYILLAWGVVEAREKRLLVGLGLAVTLLAALSLGNYYFNSAFWKLPNRDVASYVAASYRAGDVVLHTSDGSHLPAIYYQPSLEQYLLPDDPHSVRSNLPSQAIVHALGGKPQQPEQVLSGHKRAWLVVMLDHSVEHQLGVKAWFDQRYPLLLHTDVGGIQVYLYVLAR